MTEGWLHILAAEVQMSPGFLAALDRQLGDHASRLIGIADFATSYTLLPRDDRWTALARSALRYDLYAALAGLTSNVLTSTSSSDEVMFSCSDTVLLSVGPTCRNPRR